jgi:hypothetical protein
MRSKLTITFGLAIAAIGVALFLCAHKYSDGEYLQNYNADYKHLHELLWAAFGIAVLISGSTFAAVGLASWCNHRSED